MKVRDKRNLAPLLTEKTKDVLVDITEMGLDESLSFLIDNEALLKEIPIIKWIIASKDLKQSIGNMLFIRKYAAFIGQIYEDEVDVIASVDALRFSHEITDKIIENTIVYIERYHDELKAKLLGKLFIETFVHNHFTKYEYNSLMFSIESIHPVEGFPRLKDFYNYWSEMESTTNKEEKQKIWQRGAGIDYQPLIMSGLLILPSGASTFGNFGGAYLNDKGVRFYEYVVKEIISSESR
ncbi:hypothetical protein [Aeromonas veronii]